MHRNANAGVTKKKSILMVLFPIIDPLYAICSKYL